MSTPCKNLHIYRVKGRVPDAQNRFNDPFIGNWQEENEAFLFFARPADDQVRAQVAPDPELELIDKYCISYADWHGGEIRPFSTDRFYVAPPWAGRKAGAGHVPITIDPGVVFGAGTHPTTRSCLEAIEIACEKGEIESAADLGTGTGLLALAAAGLGCRRVLAVDNNYLAVRTAHENIARNRMETRVLAVQADARLLVDCPADLLIANIHFEVMRHLLASPAFYEKTWFVLSGLMRSQARYVEEAICYGPGHIVQRWIDDGIWYTFLASCGEHA